ncbi:MAG: ParB/RepB/Spo0J family partition protein [Gaiellales bacterium]
MARPTGLGRGLNALLDPAGGEPTLVTLPIEQVQPNPRQPRRAFDQEALDDLARSIKQDGIMQPIVVRSAPDGRYEIIAGERRWRAAGQAGLTTIPAIVRRADERQTLTLALVENVVREDLNAVETARGYAALIDELDLTPTEVAEKVGKSRPAIANALRLLELPDEVLDAIAAGELSEGHGRAILQLEDHDARRALAKRAIADGLSVREVEAAARTAPKQRRAPRGSRGGAAWFDHDLAAAATDACFRALGMVGRVSPTADGARLEIRIRSREQLEDLVARLEELEGGAIEHRRAA